MSDIYMSNSEKQWAKDNGLRKTDLVTYEYGKTRRVYKANDGRLYYRVENHWCGTSAEYCSVK